MYYIPIRYRRPDQMQPQQGTKATDRQVNYAMALMRQAGMGTDYMTSEHKKLGATMRERSGRVADWLGGMDRARISRIIDDLGSV